MINVKLSYKQVKHLIKLIEQELEEETANNHYNQSKSNLRDSKTLKDPKYTRTQDIYLLGSLKYALKKASIT